MLKFAKPAILALTVATTALLPAMDAAAGERWRHGKHHHRPVIVEKHNSDELLAAGIVGLAVGALVVGGIAAAQHNKRQRVYRNHRPQPVYRDYRPDVDPDYYPPAPGANVYYNDDPEVIYDRTPRRRVVSQRQYRSVAEPWTREWFRYCQRRFRSFDRETGTYLGYDGRRHFCQAK